MQETWKQSNCKHMSKSLGAQARSYTQMVRAAAHPVTNGTVNQATVPSTADRRLSKKTLSVVALDA